MQICLAKVQLQEEIYETVYTHIQEEKIWKSNSRCIIQKGGVSTAKGTYLRKKVKEVKEKVATIKCSIIIINGGIIPAKLLLPIPDLQKDSHTNDLESLKPLLDLLQAFYILNPPSTIPRISHIIDPAFFEDNCDNDTSEVEILTVEYWENGRYAMQGSGTCSSSEGNGLTTESDSDSSYTSVDSIARNADFVELD
ncbi:hypothetical protein L873DRAFT_1848231 [Choiromyces venosus 120613-1]|uniref:Uncharacterized protein n=1 Tax=Choiromyces venosus 120613-1 TaxID=1336337 RepID=A0A3N4J313_9PEZI|nr:hypothetical protein L873DRAFT_1848231 [Choiromyces venosus 120613-1]